MPVISSPRNETVPETILPCSEASSPEIALSSVLFPAPLAPSRATIPSSGTSSEGPFRTSMESPYTTCMLSTLSILSLVPCWNPKRRLQPEPLFFAGNFYLVHLHQLAPLDHIHHAF